MSNEFEKVRAVLGSAEDVDMDGVPMGNPSGSHDDGPPHPPHDDAPPSPAPDDINWAAVERAADQPLNDYGNGQRLVVHHGLDLMFVPRVGWHVWDGRHWVADGADTLRVRKLAQTIWRLIESETHFIKPTRREKELLEEERDLMQQLVDLEGLPADRRTEEVLKQQRQLEIRLKQIEGIVKSHKAAVGRRLTHAKNAGNNGPISHMIDESRTDLAVELEKLDADPLQVNTRSGLLQFKVTDASDDGGGKVADVTVLPHDRDQLITKMADVDYDPDATAPLFDSFLAQIQPDREMREFLQRWLGSSMLGMKTDKMAFWYGDGANGKSVLADTIARILANYSATLRVESITGTNKRAGAEATPDLIPLINARFVRTSEPDQGQRLQEGMVKAMTGGEPLAVRANYGDQIELELIAKITMGGNHKPEIQGGDGGIWRRVMLIPFDVIIPPAQRDNRLVDKLFAQAPGILNWLIEGAMMFLEQGLNPPAAVIAATDEYREESDPLGAFLLSCCRISGDHADKISGKELVDAFNYYLQFERGMNSKQPTTISKALAAKSRQWRHPETGMRFEKSKASVTQYIGLMFTDDFKRRFEAAPRNNNGQITGAGVVSGAAPHPVDDF